MYAYKITNVQNGHGYIGITTLSLKKRWSIHKYDSRKGRQALYLAMKKYGLENFKIEPIAEAASIKELRVLERALIAEHGTYIRTGNGYNMTAGGEGTFGLKQSAKYVAKMVLRFRGKPLSAEHRAKVSAAMRGVRKPNGHGAKVSAALKGIKRTPEQCANIAAAQRLKGERDRLMGTGAASPERRLASSLRFKGKPKSPETRAKMAAAARARSAEHQARIIAGIRATRERKRLAAQQTEA